jgi:hypothetical protein
MDMKPDNCAPYSDYWGGGIKNEKKLNLPNIEIKEMFFCYEHYKEINGNLPEWLKYRSASRVSG